MNLRGYDEVVSKCQKYHTMSFACYNEVERAIMKLRWYDKVVSNQKIYVISLSAIMKLQCYVEVYKVVFFLYEFSLLSQFRSDTNPEPTQSKMLCNLKINNLICKKN